MLYLRLLSLVNLRTRLSFTRRDYLNLLWDLCGHPEVISDLSEQEESMSFGDYQDTSVSILKMFSRIQLPHNPAIHSGRWLSSGDLTSLSCQVIKSCPKFPLLVSTTDEGHMASAYTTLKMFPQSKTRGKDPQFSTPSLPKMLDFIFLITLSENKFKI